MDTYTLITGATSGIGLDLAVRLSGERNLILVGRNEARLDELINQTGIGPQLGGNTSALAVNVEWGPTHIAGLPVAVTICCHAMRHKQRVL